MKERILSVTINDCEVQHFRAGGPGGQHQNKSDSATRVIHHPSGARGESREHRSQMQNNKAAFNRMVKTIEFRKWLAREIMVRSGLASPEEQVEKEMAPENLRVEGKNPQGRWVEIGNE